MSKLVMTNLIVNDGDEKIEMTDDIEVS